MLLSSFLSDSSKKALQKEITKVSGQQWYQVILSVDEQKIINTSREKLSKPYLHNADLRSGSCSSRKRSWFHQQFPQITSSVCNVSQKSQQVTRKNIENKTASIILVSYKAEKCPYPEYCAVALHVKKDIAMFEIRWNGKPIKQLPPKKRLKRLGLFNLERREIRDTIKVYKIQGGSG